MRITHRRLQAIITEEASTNILMQDVDDLIDASIKESAPEMVAAIREREVDEDIDEFIDGAIHAHMDAQNQDFPDPPEIGSDVEIMDPGDKEEVTEMYQLGYEWGWNNPGKVKSDNVPQSIRKEMIEYALQNFESRITEEVLIDALERAVGWAKHSLDDVHEIIKKARKRYGWKMVPAIAGIEIFEHAILPQMLVTLTGNPAFYVVATVPLVEILAASAIGIAKSKMPKREKPEPPPGHLDWYKSGEREQTLEGHIRITRRQLRRLIRESMQPLMDPLFNMREMCKEFTLLEDHLNQPDKRCPDCINKHLMKCEALAEEAISLDKEGKYPFLAKIPNVIRGWHAAALDRDNPEALAAPIRMFRKKLTPLVVDRFEE